MLQQVNLFHGLPRPNESLLAKFNLSVMLKIAGGLFTFLILLFCYNFWKYLSQDNQLVELKEEHASLQEKLKVVNENYAKLANNAQIQSEIELLKQMVEQKKSVVQKIIDLNDHSKYGFSIYLADLGQVIVTGIWLEQIIISDNGQNIKLIGYTKNAALVTDYLNKLLATKYFSDKNFKIVHIQKNDDKPMTFTIGTLEKKEETSK